MAIKTSSELRAYMWGCMSGVGVVLGCLVLVSQISNVKWQPVRSDTHVLTLQMFKTCLDLQSDPNPLNHCIDGMTGKRL